MRANITFSKDIRHILYYHERKVTAGKAVLLMGGGFAQDVAQLSLQEKYLRFNQRMRLNRRSERHGLHISLNFHPEDQLNRNLLQRITLDYFRRIGFRDQPFIAYEHLDTAHPHLHIVSTTIGLDGKRLAISPSKLGRGVTDALGRDYGLRPSRPYDGKLHHISAPEQLVKLVYGQSEVKPAVCKVVQSIVDAYKFTCLTELNAVLRNYNIAADSGRVGSWLNEHKGLYYRAVDHHGKLIGKPIKASSIYGKPTRFFLEQLYPHNERERRPYGVRLRYLLDEAQRCPSFIDGMKFLQKHLVQLMFYTNHSGKFKGLAYVDRATHVVFKSDGLGAKYSAKRILALLSDAKDRSREPLPAQAVEQPLAGMTQQHLLQKLQRIFPGTVLFMTDYGASEYETVAMQQTLARKESARLHL